MCGIVGYIGRREAVPVLIEGLRRLEYRGYDSAGLAVIYRGKLQVTKTAGRVQDLRDQVSDRVRANVGIGHTRWATHGEPNETNAHPHLDASGHIALVHNGIIENAEQLRDQLTAAGVPLVSDTDTEALAHLIAAEIAGGEPGMSLEDAVRQRAEPRRGHLRAAGHGRPAPRRAGRGAQRQPHRARYRGWRDVRRLRRRRARPAHPAGRLPRRRRDRHGALQRLPDPHAGQPEHQQDPDDGRGRGRRLRARRVRGLHAQGDPRAARGAAPDAPRPPRRALRHRAPRRYRPGRPPAPVGAAGQVPRLRLGLLRRPDGRGAGRGAGPGPRGRRARVGVPLPEPGGRPGHPVRGDQPVRGDAGHADGRAGAEAQGRPGARRRQRGRQRDRARMRQRRVPARRAGDRGRLHQGADQYDRVLRPARAADRPGPRHVRGRGGPDRRGHAGAAGAHQPRAGRRKTRSPRSPASSRAPITCSSSAASAPGRWPAKARRS